MQPDFTQPAPAPNPPSTPPKKSKKRLVLIVAVMLLLVAAAAAAFYVWKTISDREALEGAVAQVSITKDGFVPASILIVKGQSITWVNDDNKIHQLTADQPELESLGTEELGPGETLNFTFDEPGTFTYHDPLNPSTHKGTVIVE